LLDSLLQEINSMLHNVDTEQLTVFFNNIKDVVQRPRA